MLEARRGPTMGTNATTMPIPAVALTLVLPQSSDKLQGSLLRSDAPLAPPPLEKGRSVREADRVGIMRSARSDPHPPRCARRPPLFKGRWEQEARPQS